MTNIPYTFDRSHSTADVVKQFEDKIETGEHGTEKVSVAGRLMLRRGQGKLAFGQLQDASGRIQLFAPADVTPNFSDFTSLSLGDWIGVSGTVMKTRKGELSVQVEEWTMLAPAKRPFPDKWHGLTDTDTRYRQRYVDLWVNEESRKAFVMRSQMVARIRGFFQERGFMEVETPMLHPVAGGALAKPFITHHNALDMDMFLRIAPELYLKRLLVGGFESVFEIGRNFRNEGVSPRHNPEFTMLEAYQAYGDYNTFMELIENLVSTLAVELTGSTTITHQGRELNLAAPWRRATLVSLISEAVGEDVSLETSIERLRELAEKYCGHADQTWGPGKLLLELYEKTVETELWEPTFVVDMPKEVSPLARDHRSIAGMAEHVDAVVAGRELAPIYTELTDADEQRSRFEEQGRQKAAGDDEAMSVDNDFLRALDYGMPPTAGLGLGIDRLIMLLADVSNIRDVVLFPALRPEVWAADGTSSNDIIADADEETTDETEPPGMTDGPSGHVPLQPGPILFDFDGCLVDSEKGIIESLQATLPKYGVHRTAEQLRVDIGPPFQVTWIEQYGMTQAQMNECLVDYRAHYGAGPMHDVVVYDGIPELFDELAGRGRSISVATSKAEPFVKKVIEHLGWTTRFETICGSTMDGSRMLKVDVIAEALRRLGQISGVMVGDREPDMVGAKANGLDAIGVRWGFASVGELEATEPTAIIDHPKDLLEML